ncbi:uncharacterized protein LOC114520600 isoform X2 [Dendronephthya gigantea]|uniref:uncharacterized protein LOC114520600 isoform X2 n=1 Tax=Dendronephthya gigantea TaxID=151771 RepID=UPI0010691F66|nr:uncharacterized protein LOC114520600 isoform X2 [Dendronephthya gigantea]
MDKTSAFTVSSEKYNSKTLRIFRQVARGVSGESLEPGENDVVLFGRVSGGPGQKTDVVSVACARPQKIFVSDNPQDVDLYHWINFLFVLKDYQGIGYGRQILHKMEQLLWYQSPATIRIESAMKAVVFFRKMGYVEVGEPIDCVHSSSALFRTLQIMEKPFKRAS